MPECKQPILCRYGDIPPEYDPRQPWRQDELGQRRVLAQSITNLLQESQKPYVIGINAEWGMGKSFFLTCWRDDLKNKKHPCLLFNAWKYDYSDKPFLSFVAALDEQMENNRQEADKKEVYDAWLEIKAVISRLLSSSLQLSGAVAGTSLGVSGPMVCGADELSSSVISLFKETSRNREDLREAFKVFARQLTKSGKGPLIVMIDDLDRCKPDFAIALLEDIKHLFLVEGIAFILAVERKQLAKCIGATYGLDNDGAGKYLSKFIDANVDLPVLDAMVFIKRIASYYPLKPKNWIAGEGGDDYFVSFPEFVAQVLGSYRLNLKDISQIICRLSIICQIEKINQLDLAALTILLVYTHLGGSFAECVTFLQRYTADSELYAFEAHVIPSSLRSQFMVKAYLAAINDKILKSKHPQVKKILDSYNEGFLGSRASTPQRVREKEFYEHLYSLVNTPPKYDEWITFLHEYINFSHQISIG